jgi:hypothetical protein
MWLVDEGPAMKELLVLLIIMSLSAGSAAAITYHPVSMVVSVPDYSGVTW